MKLTGALFTGLSLLERDSQCANNSKYHGMTVNRTIEHLNLFRTVACLDKYRVLDRVLRKGEVFNKNQIVIMNVCLFLNSEYGISKTDKSWAVPSDMVGHLIA
jgi:hypothetical protein